MSNKTILTVELRCYFGHADIFLSNKDLPSRTNYDQCKYYNHVNNTNRTCRLTTELNESGTYFIGISSEYGSKYEIWAICSSQPRDVTEAIRSTNKILRGLDILSNNCVDDLHMYLPKLYHQAHSIADSEFKVSSESIVSEMINYSAATRGNNAKLVSSKEEDEAEEFDVLDRFVAKQGRIKLKKSLLNKKLKNNSNFVSGSLGRINGDDDDDVDGDEADDADNLYLHSEMFIRPNNFLRDNRSIIAEIVEPVDPIPSNKVINETSASLVVAGQTVPTMFKEFHQLSQLPTTTSLPKLAQKKLLAVPKPISYDLKEYSRK
jgi:hypothetical protein